MPTRQVSRESARVLRHRRLLGGLTVLAAIGCLVSTFLAWLTWPVQGGGIGALSGWGDLSGAGEAAGQSLNETIGGYGSFRPGVIATMVAAFALLTGPVLAFAPIRSAKSQAPHRITAAVLALLGLVATGWGIWRAIDPDSLQIFQPGDGASSGAGTYLCLCSGAVLLGVAVAIFLRVVDQPAQAVSRHGIQP